MQLQDQESRETNAGAAAYVPIAAHTTEAETLDSVSALRVTPQEVAMAAAALEAKRDAEHTWRETTLPIEEAIQYLGLNATAQELAPEVVALRAERSRSAAKAQQEEFGRQLGNGLRIVLIPAVLVGIAAALWFGHVQARHNAHSAAVAMTTLPIQKLAGIPDNVPVHIDADTLLKLATDSVKPENVSVDTRVANSDGTQSATMFNNEWTLVKADGILLVKGWATAEWALNISNDSTGTLFSTPPSWIPINNRVPIQVPIYRFENQTLGRYAQDGKAVESGANSVLMEASVANTSTAVQELIRQDIMAAKGNFVGSLSEDSSYVDTSVENGIVELTGTASDASMKKLAGDIAAGTLQRLHLPYTVSNKLGIRQKGQ